MSPRVRITFRLRRRSQPVNFSRPRGVRAPRAAFRYAGRV
jgi:hypothetical protein